MCDILGAQLIFKIFVAALYAEQGFDVVRIPLRKLTAEIERLTILCFSSSTTHAKISQFNNL
jgi:hypothetical protein